MTPTPSLTTNITPTFPEHLRSLSPDILLTYRISISDLDFFPGVTVRVALEEAWQHLESERRRRTTEDAITQRYSNRQRIIKMQAAVVQNFKDGSTVAEIAVNHKISKPYVYKILQKFSLHKPTIRKNNAHKKAEIIAAHERGDTQRSICKEFHTSFEFIRKCLLLRRAQASCDEDEDEG